MISRRDLLRSIPGTVGLLGWPPGYASGEPPPETTTLRTAHGNTMCEAPQSFAEELLRAEGFTDVRYVVTPNVDQELAAGQVDMVLRYSAPLSVLLDTGVPVVILAGVHIGCIDLFVSKEVRSVRELKGRRVAMDKAIGSATDLWLASILAHVGLHPHRDVHWVDMPFTEWPAALTAGKLDGFLSWPPYAQELRERKIGRVILSTTTDRPWSQYFCCMVTARKEYVEKHPVATKRALRAILKATDVCAQEPGRVARWLVDRGYTKRVEIAERMLRELPYNKWREYDPEDTFRFYALRLHEAGLIKSSPKKLIAQGTDWRFLNELKKELKG
jgi:NitT/TauT family transport system substrate-binding protein